MSAEDSISNGDDHMLQYFLARTPIKGKSGRELDSSIPVDTLPPLNEPPTELFAQGMFTPRPLSENI